MDPDEVARQRQVGGNHVSAGGIRQAPYPVEALGGHEDDLSQQNRPGEFCCMSKVPGGFTQSQ